MPSVTIPLVGNFISNERYVGVTNNDQLFTNVIFDVAKNPVTGSASVYAMKRPGWGKVGLIDPALGDGGELLIGSTGVFYHVFGKKIFRHTTEIADFSSATNKPYHLYEAEVGSTKYLMFFVDASAYSIPLAKTTSTYTGSTADTTSGSADLLNFSTIENAFIGRKITGTGIPADTYVQSISGSTVTMTNNATATGTGVSLTLTSWAKVIDPDFPSMGPSSTYITKFVQIDGYLCFGDMTNSRIYNFDLNSITSIGASSYITTNSSPDGLRGLGIQKNLIVAFNERTIEFFFNAGNPSGSPLSRSNQLTIGIGMAGHDAFCVADDDIYFLGTGLSGYSGVFKLSNYQASQVSTRSIVEQGFTGDPIFFKINGLGYVMLTTIYRRYVYCIDVDLWTEWKSSVIYPTLVTSQRADATGAVYALSAGYRYHINTLTAYVHEDDGTAYDMIIETTPLDFDTENRKFFKKVSILGCDSEAGSTATLRINGVDYTLDLSVNNPFVTRCGSYVGRQKWKLTHSSNNAFRAKAIKIDYEVGAH